MDTKLSAEEMAVGGVPHWDLLVKQQRERENQGIVCGVRDSGWSLFFFSLLYYVMRKENKSVVGLNH